MLTTQLEVPLQAPPQPAKLEPLPGVAVRVTVAPLLKLAVQLAPQLIPAGELVTVPLPVPALVTLRAKLVPEVLKVAVTDLAALMVRVQLPVPVQPPPLQPAKLEPLSAVAVRVTVAFWVKLAVQVDPQLIPAGLLKTVPDPVPFLETVSAKVEAAVVVKVWLALLNVPDVVT